MYSKSKVDSTQHRVSCLPYENNPRIDLGMRQNCGH